MEQSLSGRTLGQYDVKQLISDNLIIQTYLAIQTSLDREVAIHVVNPNVDEYDLWQDALVAGAKIASALEHPNIVPIIDLGQHEDTKYVVARHILGNTLNTLMKLRKLQLREIASIISQIASALDYAHTQNYYHGDPATINILVDEIGNAYIADFYLAGLLSVTSSTNISGVPLFMSPERFQEVAPNAYTDQYALASIAYYILTNDTERLEAKFAIQESKSLQTYRAEIPLAVDDVINKALSLTPLDRYPTILDFSRSFDRALADIPHIFISYSRRNIEYAQILRDDLTERHLTVWIDDHIEHGDHWFSEINTAIETCGAVIVIMSPQSEASEWVHKEILLAKRYGKPIYPLLLEGDEFPILIDLQFGDVRQRQLPEIDFYRRISRAIYGV